MKSIIFMNSPMYSLTPLCLSWFNSLINKLIAVTKQSQNKNDTPGLSKNKVNQMAGKTLVMITKAEIAGK